MVVGGSSRVHLLSESHIAPTAEAPEQLCLVVLLAWGILACRATLPEGQGLVHAVVFAPPLPAPSHARAVCPDADPWPQRCPRSGLTPVGLKPLALPKER